MQKSQLPQVTLHAENGVFNEAMVKMLVDVYDITGTQDVCCLANCIEASRPFHTYSATKRPLAFQLLSRICTAAAANRCKPALALLPLSGMPISAGLVTSHNSIWYILTAAHGNLYVQRRVCNMGTTGQSYRAVIQGGF